jgi:hypothetical protein
MTITKKIAKMFLEHKGYEVKGIMHVVDIGVNVEITYKPKNARMKYEVGCMSYLKEDVEYFWKTTMREKKMERILNGK